MNRYGYTEPRIFTPPLRELTEETSLGFLCAEYAETILKEELYPWQRWALIHSLEINGSFSEKWQFRFRTVLFMIARQNGKTKLSYIIASFFMNILNVPNVFGTSLSLDKAEEVWEAVISAQESHPELAERIDRVSRTNGNKRLVLKGGTSYKVGAPTRRAGRGDSNDLVLLDEVREQRDFEVLAAAAASTNAKPNGIIVCFSNAGDPDSVVLRQMRERAIAKIEHREEGYDFGGDVDASTLGLFEWSAPDDAETDDMEALAQANPALGYGYLTERALLSNRQTFPEAKFRSECMCQQVETLLPQPFPDGAWDAGVDETSRIAPTSDIVYGIDMSHDRRYTTIAACGMRDDGNYHIEVVARRAGTEWAIDWFRARARRQPMKLAFQSRGAPVAGLAEQICTLTGVERCPIEGPNLTAGWGRFWDAVAAADPKRGGVRVYHLPQPVLDAPGKTCQTRNLGGGTEVPDRVKSPDDPAPLIACYVAFAAMTVVETAKVNKIYESAYASGAGLTLL